MNSGGSTPSSDGQRTEGIEIFRASSIDSEIDIAIPEALQDLAETTQANLALTANLFQVDLDRNDLLRS